MNILISPRMPERHEADSEKVGCLVSETVIKHWAYYRARSPPKSLFGCRTIFGILTSEWVLICADTVRFDIGILMLIFW